ncbi:hypothetical protein LSCM1_00242 [Leishmania martiniquensis]|uniref:Short-chain dehydrogenase n=1 Tax=Leishmania martiniquensis TaxID=1580590 RepID=A0A836K9N9_9TRYP|nr:hypothetical protein LSCM1_00242 [Leishmania martiniquensis]
MILLAFICGTMWALWSAASFFMYRPRLIIGARVVVTGACSEMGRRLCMALYARGADVIAWDYSKTKLQELQAEVLKAESGVGISDAASAQSSSHAADSFRSGTFAVMAVDVSSRLQVQRAAKELEGSLDMIVNAAHTYPSKRLSDRSEDSAERVVQTNLLAPLVVVHQLLPLLLSKSSSSSSAGGLFKAKQRREDYAQVVNLVSAAASYTLSAESPEYAASQWGMVGMHYSMREWIAQQRNYYMTGVGCGAPSERMAAASKNTRERRPAREVRMTLLCLNEIRQGLSPMASSPWLSSPGMPTGAWATSLKAPSSSAGSPECGEEGSVSPRGRATLTCRDSHTQFLQSRKAELDKATVCCMNAILRGQERYCYSAAWATTVVYPLLMACPVPWAIRLLRRMQHPPAASAAER